VDAVVAAAVVRTLAPDEEHSSAEDRPVLAFA
jgi:hypothetical protein